MKERKKLKKERRKKRKKKFVGREIKLFATFLFLGKSFRGGEVMLMKVLE
jgi:hypothetical protein